MALKELTERAEDLWHRVAGAVRRRRTFGTGVPVSRAPAGAGEQLDAAEHVPPLADVLEGERELVIVADVPGADPRRTEVTWDGERGLTLHAHGPEMGDETAGVHWMRAFAIPGGFDGARATAALGRGVLTVRVPRSSSHTPRAIPVRAGR